MAGDVDPAIAGLSDRSELHQAQLGQQPLAEVLEPGVAQVEQCRPKCCRECDIGGFVGGDRGRGLIRVGDLRCLPPLLAVLETDLLEELMSRLEVLLVQRQLPASAPPRMGRLPPPPPWAPI